MQAEALLQDEVQISWKKGSRLQGNPAIVAAELDRIEALKGAVDAETVVDSAIAPESPLHSYFEWDDGKAGHRYRLDQARQLIRAIVVTRPVPGSDETLTTRARVAMPVRIRPADPDEMKEPLQHYVRIEDALADPEQQAILLGQARKDFSAFVEKYKGLSRLAELIPAWAEEEIGVASAGNM